MRIWIHITLAITPNRPVEAPMPKRAISTYSDKGRPPSTVESTDHWQLTLVELRVWRPAYDGRLLRPCQAGMPMGSFQEAQRQQGPAGIMNQSIPGPGGSGPPTPLTQGFLVHTAQYRFKWKCNPTQCHAGSTRCICTRCRSCLAAAGTAQQRHHGGSSLSQGLASHWPNGLTVKHRQLLARRQHSSPVSWAERSPSLCPADTPVVGPTTSNNPSRAPAYLCGITAT